MFSDSRRTLFDRLNDAKFSWQKYYTTVPGAGVFVDDLSANLNEHTSLVKAFFTDAEAGTLEHVVFLDPNLRDDQGAAHNDDHPPGSAQFGDQLLADVVRAVTNSQQWPRRALFITWDVHGGLYDHVVPPAACPPDDNKPLNAKGKPVEGGFDGSASACR